VPCADASVSGKCKTIDSDAHFLILYAFYKERTDREKKNHIFVLYRFLAVLLI
jgi:uncharacterized protein YdaL